ncbi:MAG: hypothetical protein ACHP65_08945 [Legionellales bacterium]
MIKKAAAFFLYSVSITSIACSAALPTNDANFCSSFQSVAPCYCTSSGLPTSMCQNMNVLYSRMIGLFGSLQKACEYQRYTSVQDCVDNWNCYRLGGINSHGQNCSATQKACV